MIKAYQIVRRKLLDAARRLGYQQLRGRGDDAHLGDDGRCVGHLGRTSVAAKRCMSSELACYS